MVVVSVQRTVTDHEMIDAPKEAVTDGEGLGLTASLTRHFQVEGARTRLSTIDEHQLKET